MTCDRSVPRHSRIRHSQVGGCVMNEPKTQWAEVNVLRLPWFTLDRRTSVTAIEASGSYDVDGQHHEWSLSASPSAQWGWPGPLARKAHMALLGIAARHARPVANPITWRWPDLLSRMGVVDSGRTRRQVEDSLLAIAGLTVVSERAVFDAVARSPVEAGRVGTHLFDRVQFIRRGRCDTNAVWLSEWYVGNLNAAWTRNLDDDLWRRLDNASHVASRLYEYLLYGQSHEALSVRYTTLASYLPVVRQTTLWRAKAQLGEALDLLVHENVLADTRWETRDDCVAILHLARGAAIRGRPHSAPPQQEPATTVPVQGRAVRPEPQSAPPSGETVKVQTANPAEALLQEWAKARQRSNEVVVRHNDKDQSTAEALLHQYGMQRAKKIVTALAATVAGGWRGCIHFDAAWVQFQAEALAAVEATDRQEKRQAETDRLIRESRGEAERQGRWEQFWLYRWRLIPVEYQEQIRERLRRKCRFRLPDRMLQNLCLKEISDMTRRSVEEYLRASGRTFPNAPKAQPGPILAEECQSGQSR